MDSLKKIVLATLFYFYNHFVTHIPSYGIRHFYLRKILRYKIGKNSAVHMGCFFTGQKFTMGDNSVVNRDCYLDCRAGILIRDNISISPQCYIISQGHDPQSPFFDGTSGLVTFDDYAWIGARALILPGLTIGKGGVVGAGSVVTKDVEPFCIVAGNPAVFIRKRTTDLQYTINWFPYFDTDIM